MANDKLRAALRNAGLAPDELADIVQVDIRTVRRWLSGRPPYPRHRGQVARALDTTEHNLWPDIALPTPNRANTVPTANEIIAAVARADDLRAPTTETLIQTATEQIDLLDNTLQRLLTRPGLHQLLTTKASHGCPIRILLAEPGPYLTPLLGHDRIQIRKAEVVELHAVHRLDDHMLLTLRLTGESDRPPPLLHLHRRAEGGLFDRLAEHFDHAWEHTGQPIRAEHDIDPQPLEGQPDARGEHVSTDRADAAQDRPLRQPSQPSTSRPRRWPRRPPNDN
jgi:hypothetical protein